MSIQHMRNSLFPPPPRRARLGDLHQLLMPQNPMVQALFGNQKLMQQSCPNIVQIMPASYLNRSRQKHTRIIFKSYTQHVRIIPKSYPNEKHSRVIRETYLNYTKMTPARHPKEGIFLRLREKRRCRDLAARLD